MEREKYTLRELEEIKKRAIWFKVKNFWRFSITYIGHKVASRNPDLKVRNFSTITTCFQLSTGKWIFLVYNYPLSVIHRIQDAFAKWATEKYCIKVMNRKEWKEIFIRKSFISIIPLDVRNVVAMPYIENQNLFHILIGRIGNYSFAEKEGMVKEVVRIINDMHRRGIVWGELITQNMVRSQEGRIILCDTETVYYRGSLIEQKVLDWQDFICSAVGSLSWLHPEKVSYLVRFIVNQIQDEEVRQCLKKKCRKKRTLLHRIFFFSIIARLACTPKLYKRIRAEIAFG